MPHLSQIRFFWARFPNKRPRTAHWGVNVPVRGAGSAISKQPASFGHGFHAAQMDVLVVCQDKVARILEGRRSRQYFKINNIGKFIWRKVLP